MHKHNVERRVQYEHILQHNTIGLQPHVICRHSPHHVHVRHVDLGVAAGL